MNFFLFRAAPGDPVDRYKRIPGVSKQEIEELRDHFGVGRPVLVQYREYLGQLAHGNLGRSFNDQQPVAPALWQAIKNTAPMVLLGVSFAVLFGVAAGAIAAWRRNTAADYLATGAALFLYALPAQWLGLMLALLFAGSLPAGGRVDEFLLEPSFLEHQLDILRHMILPSLTLGLVLFGQYALVTRSVMVETLASDYILTARAKGLRGYTILRRHALPNALLPITTLVALSLGFVVSGSLLIETIFSWPGIGSAVYEAVQTRDWPTLQGAFLVITVTVILLNLIADLLYSRLDPRVAHA